MGWFKNIISTDEVRNIEFRLEMRFVKKDLQKSDKDTIAEVLCDIFHENGDYFLEELNEYRSKHIFSSRIEKKKHKSRPIQDIWTFLECALDSFYEKYLIEHHLTKYELSRPHLCDKLYKEGSLILTFSLFFSVAADVITVSNFVTRYAEWVSNLSYSDLRCYATVNPKPTNLTMNNHMDSRLNRLTIINTTLLAILIIAFIAYCIMTANKEEQLKQEIEQLVNKNVQQAIDHEKINFLFYNTPLPAEQPTASQTDSTKKSK